MESPWRVMEGCVLVGEIGWHPDTVLRGLNRLRLSKELCDVVLCCGGQEFPCHRAVLASFSSYFQAMFTCGMLESRQDRVNIHGVEAHILDLLLTFAYTSEVAIPEEHVQDVAAAAQMLDVEAVLESCCSYMRDHLDNNNCLGIYIFAEAHSLEELEFHSLPYIIKHFGDVYMQEEFLSLPVDLVTYILSDEDLNVPKEEAVFEAAMLWINKCPTRRQHFEKFLELIRLPLISPCYLHDVIESLELVKESQYCQRLISEAKERHHLPYSEAVHPRRTQEVMVLVGGQSGGKMLDRVEWFNPASLLYCINEQIYKNLARLPFKGHKHGLAVSGTALYVAGGTLPDGSVSKKLWRYDPSHDDSRTKMASMNEARCDFGLVVLDGSLWAVGGQDCSECFVERYEPRSNTWQLSQDMPRCSNHPVVVALDGLIYVFGMGHNDTAQLQPYKIPICGCQGRREEAASRRALEQSVVQSPDSPDAVQAVQEIERWLRDEDAWLESTVAYYDGFMRPAEGPPPVCNGPLPLPSPDLVCDEMITTSSGSHKEAVVDVTGAASRPTCRLAAQGGQVPRVPRATSVPAYKYNPKTTEWTEVAPMQVPRSASAACTLNGKIYIIGGENFSGFFSGQVECYDPTTNQWTMCASMLHQRRDFGVVAMHGKIYVLGGMDADCEAFPEIQAYCDQTDKWECSCNYGREGSYYRRRWRGPKGRSFFSCASLWLSTDVKDVPYPKPHDSSDSWVQERP